MRSLGCAVKTEANGRSPKSSGPLALSALRARMCCKNQHRRRVGLGAFASPSELVCWKNQYSGMSVFANATSRTRRLCWSFQHFLARSAENVGGAEVFCDLPFLSVFTAHSKGGFCGAPEIRGIRELCHGPIKMAPFLAEFSNRKAPLNSFFAPPIMFTVVFAALRVQIYSKNQYKRHVGVFARFCPKSWMCYKNQYKRRAAASTAPICEVLEI